MEAVRPHRVGVGTLASPWGAGTAIVRASGDPTMHKLASLSKELIYLASEQLRCCIYGSMLLAKHHTHLAIWQSGMNCLYPCFKERWAIASQKQKCRGRQITEMRRLEDILI